MKTLICLMTLIFSMSLFAQDSEVLDYKVKDLKIYKSGSTKYENGYRYILYNGDEILRLTHKTKEEIGKITRFLGSLKSVNGEQIVTVTLTEGDFKIVPAKKKVTKAEMDELKATVKRHSLSVTDLLEGRERDSIKIVELQNQDVIQTPELIFERENDTITKK